MNRNLRPFTRSNQPGLEAIVEPLVGYICATERPQVALQTVLAALVRQVEQTNRSAQHSRRTFMASQLTGSPE